jgi:succinoglycan biosynthesis transport protein ExoP
MTQEDHPPRILPSGTYIPDNALAAPLADSASNRYPLEAVLPPAEVVGLIEYWRILRRSKGTLILIAFAGALLGFLIALPQTPIYQARTSVEVVGLNDNFMNMKQVNPINQGGASADVSDIQTQIKILQSESLLDRVLSKMNFGKGSKISIEPAKIAEWRTALKLENSSPFDARDAALRMAATRLKVRASGQTRLLEIFVESPDPKIAADFANTLTEQFIEGNLESRWKTTERTGEWLNRELDAMKIKLEKSEDQLQAYARAKGLIFTSEKTNISEDKLRQLQLALSTSQADRVAKQARFEMAMSAPPESLPDVLNDQALRDYQAKLTDLRRQVAELVPTYTPEHIKVKRVQNQLFTIETALDRERDAILRRIRNEYDEAVRKEKLLADDYANQAKQVTGESERSIQYNIMKHEVDSNRALYDTMLQKLKEATIASALQANNVRVVDPAKIPKRPFKPDVLQSVLLGLFTGGLLGAVFIVLRERADSTIQQPGDSSFLNLPELGIIPAYVSVGKRRLSRPAEGLALNGDKEDGAFADKVELVTWQSKPSMLAESFRSTLISILFSTQSGDRPRVLVMSSAGPSEGKSTISSNLAIAIAEVGQKVLLIDADIRRPRQHEVFGLPNTRGLSDLLREKRDETPAVKAEQQTGMPGLSVLTAGTAGSAATTLFYSSRMPEILNHYRKEYDTVVVDTPPMLQIPDARVLGRMADSVILVLRAGKTTRDAATAARQRFAEDGTKVLGTILNDWNPKSSPNGYYGYYNGYYKGYHGYDGSPERGVTQDT